MDDILLLDSDVLIDYLRSRAKAVEFLEGLVPTAGLFELCA